MCLIFVLKKGGRLERCNGQVTKREGGAQLQNKLISRGSTWRRTGILLVTGYRTTTRCSVETLDVFIPTPPNLPLLQEIPSRLFSLYFALCHTDLPKQFIMSVEGGSKQLYFAPKLKYISLVSSFQIRVWPICNRIYSHLL